MDGRILDLELGRLTAMTGPHPCADCGLEIHSIAQVCRDCLDDRHARLANEKDVTMYGGVVRMAQAGVRDAVRVLVLAGGQKQDILDAMRDGVASASEPDERVVGHSADSATVTGL